MFIYKKITNFNSIGDKAEVYRLLQPIKIEGKKYKYKIISDYHDEFATLSYLFTHLTLVHKIDFKKSVVSTLSITALTIAAWETGKAIADYYMTSTKPDVIESPKDYVGENHLRPRFLK